MKRTIIAISAAILAMSCSKTGYIIYEDNVASRIYFTNAVSSQIVSVDAIDADGNCFLTLKCAGNNSERTTVSIGYDTDALDVYNAKTGMEYAAIPQDCFSIPQSTFTMDTGDNCQITFPVHIEAGSVMSLGEGYLLPLSISSDKPADIVYEFKTVFLQFNLNQH